MRTISELTISDEKLDKYDVSKKRAEELKQKFEEIDGQHENPQTVIEETVSESIKLDVAEALIVQTYVKKKYVEEGDKEDFQSVVIGDEEDEEQTEWEEWFKSNEDKILELIDFEEQ